MSSRTVGETTLNPHSSPTNPTNPTSSGQLPCSAVLWLARNWVLCKNWDWSRDWRISEYVGKATVNLCERRARSEGCLFNRSVTSSSTVSATNSNRDGSGSRLEPIQERSSAATLSVFEELMSHITERMRRFNSDGVACWGWGWWMGLVESDSATIDNIDVVDGVQPARS